MERQKSRASEAQESATALRLEALDRVQGTSVTFERALYAHRVAITMREKADTLAAVSVAADDAGAAWERLNRLSAGNIALVAKEGGEAYA